MRFALPGDSPRNLPRAATLDGCCFVMSGEALESGAFTMTAGSGWIVRLSAGPIAAALLTLASAAPASAQGLFQSLFGELGRALQGHMPEREHIPAFAEPFVDFGRPAPPTLRAETGPAQAFCVRSCDGHFFPVRAQPGMNVVEACHAFCPASETRIYAGGNIDYAVAQDGSRYADLPNAFLYRKHLVAGCTCNGRDAFGLAHIAVAEDPTLKPGDVVATEHGFVAFTGRKDATANFTPVESYANFSPSYRAQLSALRVTPPHPGPVNAAPVQRPLPADQALNDRSPGAGDPPATNLP